MLEFKYAPQHKNDQRVASQTLAFSPQHLVEHDLKPGGVVLGKLLQVGAQFGDVHPFPIGDFVGIGARLAAPLAAKHVIELVFGEVALGVGRAVDEVTHFFQRRLKAELELQAGQRRVGCVLAAQGMRATGVAPQAGEVVFACGALLKQHFAARVEYENRKGAVKRAAVQMGFEFGGKTDDLVARTDQNQLLGFCEDVHALKNESEVWRVLWLGRHTGSAVLPLR